MDLYFEILRKKTHIFVQAKENWTIKDLKKVIEGILKVPPEKQSLRRPTNEAKTEWDVIDERSQTLHDLGYNVKNAKADDPALLVVVLPEDNDKPDVVPVSVPPPLPDAMRHRDSELTEECRFIPT